MRSIPNNKTIQDDFLKQSWQISCIDIVSISAKFMWQQNENILSVPK